MNSEGDAFGCGLMIGGAVTAFLIFAGVACLGIRAEFTTVDKRLDEVAADVVVIRRAIEAPPPIASPAPIPVCIPAEAP